MPNPIDTILKPTNIKQNHKVDRRQNSDPPLSQYASLLVIKVMHDAY
jgi:hypothetical protein